MLFNKKIDPSCSYCEKGSRISETEVICVKRGIVSSNHACRKFSYDPLKRTPPAPVKLKTDDFSEDDFKL